MTYTQANRPLAITTPLGPDVLLLVGFNGQEAISQLFNFQVELLAEKRTKIPFEGILGQKVTVRMDLPDGGKRYFNGIVKRFLRGRDAEVFTHFQAEIVPQFWLSTKKVRSRIFQHLSVPQILEKVLAGLNVAFQIDYAFKPRDYCVQYRESDFAFASRLLEEEGLYYFFEHTADNHRLVVTDRPLVHPALPEPNTIVYDEKRDGTHREGRVTAWTKAQELRSSQYTLWDHCFELPGKNLEAQRLILDSVDVGKVHHKLKVNANAPLEIHDYPGGYAQRFDGVGSGGADRSADLADIFTDNGRTAKVRMEQEALLGLEIQGASTCAQFSAGYEFGLTRHSDGDGKYLLLRIEHTARLVDDYRSGDQTLFDYQNRFTAIPAALPYRTPQVTPKPTVPGMQTAIVVGPPREEIFCDKYGRGKVQFHWDREGKKNADSSCWLRVGHMAAGKGFGALQLPRIGQEVIVAFLEGDPDQPIIVGSVYNAENMPPYKLPEQRNFSGITHRSVGGVRENASELRFESQLGQERMLLHAETDFHQNVENNQHVQVGKFHSEFIGVKVNWDKGKLSNTNSRAVGSGVGGGTPIAPQPGAASDKVESSSTMEPNDDKPTPGTGLNSGAGGGDFDAKNEDSYVVDTKGDKHAKLRFVQGGADDTVDDQGKTTFVRFGSITEIRGGSFTRIFKENASQDYGSALVPPPPSPPPPPPKAGSSPPPPKPNMVSQASDTATTSVAYEFKAFQYPLELPAQPFDNASTTEVHGDTSITVYGNTFSTTTENVTVTIGGNKTTTIQQGATTTIYGDSDTTIQGKRSSTVTGLSTSLLEGMSTQVALAAVWNTVLGAKMDWLMGAGLSLKLAEMMEIHVGMLLHLHEAVKCHVQGGHIKLDTPAGPVNNYTINVNIGITVFL